jgi:predicted P-loop ATPase
MGARAEEYAQPWREDLQFSKNGSLSKRLANLDIIFKEDARFRGSIEMDEMTRGLYYKGVPATDAFAHRICAEFGEYYHGHPFRREEIVSAAMAYAETNTFHRVRNMLYSLPVWDGQHRIERIIPEILHTPPTETTQLMMRKFLIGAVRRPLDPGGQHDTVLVLVGKQGVGKSSFFRILGGEFHNDTPVDSDSKDRFLTIQSSWIMELAELDGMTSLKTAQSLKGLITSAVDRFRPPYGKSTVINRRSCVMVGTTNTTTFLMDPTGDRRYWPITMDGVLNRDLLVEWRDQILAEAMVLEAAGETHFMTIEEEETKAELDHEFKSHDPWTEDVMGALQKIAGRGENLMDGVSTKDLLDAMDVPIQTRNRSVDLRICTSMRAIGWESQQKMVKGLRRRLWFPNALTHDPVAANETANF